MDPKRGWLPRIALVVVLSPITSASAQAPARDSLEAVIRRIDAAEAQANSEAEANSDAKRRRAGIGGAIE